MRAITSVDILSSLQCIATSDQRNMGMSMRVEQSTLDQVKKRFEVVKKRKEEEKKKYGKLKITLAFLN